MASNEPWVAGCGFYVSARKMVPDLKRTSSPVIKNTLCKQWGCKNWQSNGVRGIEFPPLADLRALFVRKHGKQEWADGEDWRF